MLYLIAVTALVSLLFITTAVGRRFADVLPEPLKDSASFFVAPLLGAAVLVLLTTAHGWLFPFRTASSIFLVLALLVTSVIFEKRRSELVRDWLLVSAFAAVVTIPVLAPAIRFDSLNPFNDTFTYLVHGQWLQQHSFSEPARASGFFPADSQVFLYQRSGLRMGGSFVLGFVQSLFHLEWSYYAYLPTVCLVFVTGCLAMAGVVRQVIPISRPLGLVLGTLPAFTLNGFVFGAQFGFFPQTFGLAFATGLACLYPVTLATVTTSTTTLPRLALQLAPVALLLSALLISYNEIFPVVGSVIGLFFIWTLAGSWSGRSRLIVAALVVTAEMVIVVNVEGFRILRSFFQTVAGAATGAAQFGWPMNWTPIQFLAHSFGMKSSFQADTFLVDRVVSIGVFPVLLVAILVILWRVIREQPRNPTLRFLLCANLVIWLAFLKFRYATPGGAGEVGYTFLQFKLAKWAAVFNLALTGIVIGWLGVRAQRHRRRLLQTAFAATVVLGMWIHYSFIAQMFTTQFRDETRRKDSPFALFLDLRSRLESVPRQQVIYIRIPYEHHKMTQMIAYILSDRRLASDYQDTYLRGSIPLAERNMPMDKADWLIQLKPTSAPDENPLNRVGPLYIRRAPFSFYSLETTTGAYPTETNGTDSWNWVRNAVEYKFAGAGQAGHFRVKLQYLAKTSPLELEVVGASGKSIGSYSLGTIGQWGAFESPPLHADTPGIIVRIKGTGTPAQLSAADPRETRFLIQNLFLDTVE